MAPKRKLPIEDIEDLQMINRGRHLLQFKVIKEWRVGKVADVDVFGCYKLAEDGIDEKTRRFQVLVGLFLSSQTKDPITAGAVRRMQQQLPKGLNPASIRDAEVEVLAELIKPVGFYRVKAGNLKKICDRLGRDYDDDIPSTLEELMELPGIGPKMAYLAMQCGWDDCIGIGVDVHVHRISRRLGWTDGDACKTPEDTRKRLEKIFPKSDWPAINNELIGFGQLMCLPVKPKCSECPLQAECPSSEVKTALKKNSKNC